MEDVIAQMRSGGGKKAGKKGGGVGGVGRRRLQGKVGGGGGKTKGKGTVVVRKKDVSGDESVMRAAMEAVEAIASASDEKTVLTPSSTTPSAPLPPIPRLQDHDTPESLVAALRRDIEALTSTYPDRRELAMERLTSCLFSSLSAAKSGKKGMLDGGSGGGVGDGVVEGGEGGDGEGEGRIVVFEGEKEGGGGGGSGEKGVGEVVGEEEDSDDEVGGGGGGGGGGGSGFGGGGVEGEGMLGLVEEVVVGALLRPVLRRVSDEAGRVREKALVFVRHYLELVCSDLSGSLPFLAPALLERCGEWSYDPGEHVVIWDSVAQEAHRRGRVVDDAGRLESLPLVEPSELARTELAACLAALWTRAVALGALALLRLQIPTLAMAAQALGRDKSPSVRIKGLELVDRVVRLSPDPLVPFAPGMVKAIAPGLRHRHAKVRLATLSAIQSLVLCPDRAKRKGAGTEALPFLVAHRDDNVIPVKAFYGQDVQVNFFAGIALDDNWRVRRRFLDTIFAWMWGLPDRIDHEGRLLPYILSAMADDNDDIRAAARKDLDRLGAREEEERQDELLEKLQHGVDGDKRVDYASTYPWPVGEVPGRPRIGTRLLVRKHAKRFLKPVLDDLGEWKGTARGRAATLLVTVLSFLEEFATDEAPKILPVLLALSVDKDPSLLTPTKHLAHCFGRFIDPDTTIPLLAPYLSGEAPLPTPTLADATEAQKTACILHATALSLAHSPPNRIRTTAWHLLADAVNKAGTLALKETPTQKPSLISTPTTTTPDTTDTAHTTETETHPTPSPSLPSTTSPLTLLSFPVPFEGDSTPSRGLSRWLQVVGCLLFSVRDAHLDVATGAVYASRPRTIPDPVPHLLSLLLATSSRLPTSPIPSLYLRWLATSTSHTTIPALLHSHLRPLLISAASSLPPPPLLRPHSTPLHVIRALLHITPNHTLSTPGATDIIIDVATSILLPNTSLDHPDEEGGEGGGEGGEGEGGGAEEEEKEGEEEGGGEGEGGMEEESKGSGEDIVYLEKVYGTLKRAEGIVEVVGDILRLMIQAEVEGVVERLMEEVFTVPLLTHLTSQPPSLFLPIASLLSSSLLPPSSSLTSVLTRWKSILKPTHPHIADSLPVTEE